MGGFQQALGVERYLWEWPVAEAIARRASSQLHTSMRPRLIPHTTIPLYGGGVGYRTSEGMQEALNSSGPLGPNPHPPPCKLIAQRSSASITQGVVQEGGFSQSGPSHN